MSELDQSVDALRTAVNDLSNRLGTAPQDLQQALADLQRVTEERDAALADDDADQAQIDSLTAERDQLLQDATENAANIQQVTDQVKALGSQSGEPPEVSPQSQVRT